MSENKELKKKYYICTISTEHDCLELYSMGEMTDEEHDKYVNDKLKTFPIMFVIITEDDDGTLCMTARNRFVPIKDKAKPSTGEMN